MPLPLIDAQWNRLHNACYSDLKLAALYDRPMTIIEVLERKDGLWSEVSDIDRIWVACWLLNPRLFKLWKNELKKFDAHAHAYADDYIHVHARDDIHTYAYAYVCAHTYAYAYVCAHTPIRSHAYIEQIRTLILILTPEL